MLKIISESLIFYEEGKTFSGKCWLTDNQQEIDTIPSIVQNILYIIYNVSNGFKDVIVKALNDNSSQHAFKKINRVFGQDNALIKEYCSNLLRL